MASRNDPGCTCAVGDAVEYHGHRHSCPCDPYMAAILAQPVGAATTDGFYELERLTDSSWRFREPSEDHPGYGEYELGDAQAAEVLRDIFPGSFNSPEGT